MFKRRWDLVLFAFLSGIVSLPAFATETDLPRSWLLSPYCKGNAPVKKVFMEAKEGEFVPAEINVTKGDCVELWIRHAGGVADKRDARAPPEKTQVVAGRGDHLSK